MKPWCILLLAFALSLTENSALSQNQKMLSELDVQIVQLYKAGKLAEAVALAKEALALAKRKFGPDHLKVGESLNNLALLYYAAGHYAEAEPLYQRTLAIREKALGSDHPDVGHSLNNLAALYDSQGRYTEAEPLYTRSLAIREKTLGPNHPMVAQSLNNLAVLYDTQGRYAEAEPLYLRSLAIREKALGTNHPDVGLSLNNLAFLYQTQGRYTEAEPLYLRSLAIRERALGSDHLDVGQSLSNLAWLYKAQGRYTEAEPLLKRSLAISQKTLGSDHPDVGIGLNSLAAIYDDQGHYAKAEPLYKRSLAISEKALGPDHPNVGVSLNNLAGLYQAQGRYAEVEPLYKRSLVIHEKALGPDHADIGTILNNLAWLYDAQKRYAEAEPLYKRSLAISEKAFGPDHPDIGTTLNNLALLYEVQGRYREAERLHKRSLAIIEKAFGRDHLLVATSLNNLAAQYVLQARYAEAASLFERSLAIREKTLDHDHPLVGVSLNNLAGLYFAQGDWTRATDYLRRGTEIVTLRTRRGTQILGQTLTGKNQREASLESHAFLMLIKAAYRQVSKEQGARKELAREAFVTAQWSAGTKAAEALTRMSARQARGDTELAKLVRERQDLVSEWQERDQLHNAAISQSPEKRNKEAEAANAARLATIDRRIAEIDKTLAVKFPDYTALANPEPLSIEEVQKQLYPDEALISFFDTPRLDTTPEETFIWVVTKFESRWVRVELGTETLKHEVQTLRCGLDSSGWLGKRCSKLTSATYTENDYFEGKPLPFELVRSHNLYEQLFGPVQDLIKGKNLLLVPSGPLTQLPFQVLVAEKPVVTTNYAEAAWLIKSHALTILPSVSSLKALRRLTTSKRALKPYLGIGNPLLDGPDPRYSTLAKRARDEYSCRPKTVLQQFAGLFGLRGGVVPLEVQGKFADPASIRQQTPLPETADELCAVARNVGAATEDIRLGAMATEVDIKHLSENGSLSDYRILHFATHGAMAGELNGSSEPGLILTPPDEGSEADDGYLTASEITTLKLEADWVILSACNTAAGEAEGAEALSGLARAFFYAGARSLLVSHWAVASEPTVKLITGTFEASKKAPQIGRSEALRRSMITMIEGEDQKLAHPEYWSPFVLVGEGRRITNDSQKHSSHAD